MIKRIELINFMSHRHTVIEPSAGLTVLVGPNNCGKSAVVAALQILCHNENSTYVLRHAEKNCQIIVETDEGHVIEWSRKKNGSPKYTINGKTFDRLRGAVPPEVHSVLRLPKVVSEKDAFDVHFGEQKNPIFLLNDSPKAAAEFFASSSDAIRLVEMQSRHKTKVRDAKRDQKQLEQEQANIEDTLELLDPIEELEHSLGACEKQFDEIFADAREISKLERTLNRIYVSSKELLFREAAGACFEKLVSPPEFEPTEELATLIREIEKTETRVGHDEKKLGKLTTVKAPPDLLPTNELAELAAEIRKATLRMSLDESKMNQLSMLEPVPVLEDLVPLESLVGEIKAMKKTVSRLDNQLVTAENNLREIKADIELWAKSNPTCPTCRGNISAETLVQLINRQGCDHDQ